MDSNSAQAGVQSPVEPKNKTGGKALKVVLIILGTIILLAAVGYAGFVLGSINKTAKNVASAIKSSVTPIPSFSPTPDYSATPTPISITLPSLDLATWKPLSSTYAGYSLLAPSDWVTSYCPGEAAVINCQQFGPGAEDGSQKFPTADLIRVNDVASENSVPKGSYNFTLGAIGNSPNAYYVKDDQGVHVYFKYKGIGEYYVMENGYLLGNLTPDQLEPYIRQMAQSLTFITPDESCEGPASLPLIDFPSGFALLNYHASDGSDKPTMLDDNHYADTKTLNRIFFVLYAKSGDSFADSSNFDNKVVPIVDAGDVYSANGTNLLYVNCSQPLELNSLENFPVGHFHINAVGDPYSVSMYGLSSNPTTLWSQAQWNKSLLQRTRNEVYIKRGSVWQKYVATDFTVFQSSCCVAGKPAIYLYPQKKEEVNVKISPAGPIFQTDNLFNSQIGGWNVVAEPDGRINNSLDYLYYEAHINIEKPDRGYVVEYKDLFDFSKNYVEKLGLNTNEASEFVKFWKSKLPKAPYYFVGNLNTADIKKYFHLSINPKPDTLLRVELFFNPLSEKINVNLPTFEKVPPRTGFTAVEWGGILDQ